MGEYCVGGGAVDWLQLVRTAVIMRGESSEGQHYTRTLLAGQSGHLLHGVIIDKHEHVNVMMLRIMLKIYLQDIIVCEADLEVLMLSVSSWKHWK